MRDSAMLWAGLLAACATITGAADEGGDAPHPMLRRDPFAAPAPPPPSAPPEQRVVQRAPPPWAPQLRGLLRGRGRSQANVEGTIVSLGEQIDGFRLVEVREREAVFTRDGRRYTLSLD